MTVPTTDERRVAIRELIEAADEFAERALIQETSRDRSRPGTGLHHQHAHSATLWRLAEQKLRTRVNELSPGETGSRVESQPSASPGPLGLDSAGDGPYYERVSLSEAGFADVV